ncbi:FxsA family protein [Aliidiomarina celeris]|uniref:FxsA family protein n=1 Tax=Aliidiomarina celeris TaxID=2249428 RepID=UPI001300A0E6|nr:FxsA family protein [Aliidiomarina celeris]
MFFPLFVLFVVMPVIEIAVLIQVGSVLGALNTIALLILTAVVGASLVRSQGLRALQNAQLKMSQGVLPGRELASGLMIFIAGIMFITPGFVTDLFALLLLLPPVQAILGVWLLKRLQAQGTHTQFRFYSSQRGDAEKPYSPHQKGGNRTLEGEYEEKEDSEKK